MVTVSHKIDQYWLYKTIRSPNETKKFKNIISKTIDFDKYAIRNKVHQCVGLIKNWLHLFPRSLLYGHLKTTGNDNVEQGRNSMLFVKSFVTWALLWSI